MAKKKGSVEAAEANAPVMKKVTITDAACSPVILKVNGEVVFTGHVGKEAEIAEDMLPNLEASSAKFEVTS